MRKSTLVCAVVAACVLTGGCGSNDAPSAAREPAKADLGWLRVYGEWAARLRSDLGAAERVRASLLIDDSRAKEFGVAVRRLSTCDDRYRRHVGTPPNDAWRHPASAALGVCQGYTAAEQKMLAAVGHEAGDLRFAGEAAFAKANKQAYLLDREFERSFIWNRALPRVGGMSSRSRIEPLFSRVAAPIARKPVQIRCWSSDEWTKVLAEFHAFTARSSDVAGFVDSAELNSPANIASWDCRQLARLAYRHDYPRSGEAFDDMSAAMSVLSHEIQHLVANGTEAQTECYGMQTMEQVARGLGAPAPYARRLAVRYWKYWYPTDDSRYHTQLCHDGGPLDANPASTRWP